MYRYFIILFCLWGLWGCQDPTPQQQADVWIVGTSADYPPFEYFQDNKIIGFDIELIQEIGKRLGKTIEIRDMSFDGLLAALQSKRIDLAISAISPTLDRAKSVDFTRPYFSTETVLVCHTLSGIHSTAELAGMSFGVQAGSIYETYANSSLIQRFNPARIRSLPRIPDLVQELKSRRLSCLILGAEEAQRLVHTQKDFMILPLEQDSAHDIPHFAIALPKDSPHRADVDTALAEIIADGTRNLLKNKWLTEDA